MRKNILIFGHNDATQFIDIFNQYTRIFDPNQYAVTVAYLTGAPSEETKQRTLAENVLFLNLPKRQIRYLKINAIKQLFFLCKEKQFEIVICHRYKPSYIMLWVTKFFPIPALICVMHELKTMRSFSRQLLVATLARKNVVFAGVSNAVRDDLRKTLWGFNHSRIVTLYNTIDIEFSEPLLFSKVEARKVLNLTNDAFVFGHIGRLVHNKDQKSLIDAFAAIKVHCKGAKLLIIGDGELEPTLKQQVAHYQLESDIIFTGFLASAFRYMKAFDCFLLPSQQEAFGRVLLEAMIAKCPIIATNINGIPEVVPENCTLVPSNQPAILAHAMQTIYQLSQPERVQLGEGAYEHTQQHFSIPAFQKQFWQVIKTTLMRNEL